MSKAISLTPSMQGAKRKADELPEEHKPQRPRTGGYVPLDGCTIEVSPNGTRFKKDVFVDGPFAIHSDGLENVRWSPLSADVVLESSASPKETQLQVYARNGWPVTVRGMTGIPTVEGENIVLRGKDGKKDVTLVIRNEDIITSTIL